MEKQSNILGLKAGLEIHQQLDTNKLFCSCPSYLRSDSPNFIIKRNLHKVAGEEGEVDIAAQFEAQKNKDFYYQGYSDTNCLLEIDESPPNIINEQALDEAIKIALLLNCETYPVTQIMRKTVIDGSNTSGFQRTLLIAHHGYIETSFGKVGIDTLALEEDAARIIERKDNQVTYRLDRLGIPLIEIATSPDLHSPEQIKEAALKIGEILRACKVKRGIGTIRQDVNISIKGHDRVEIKGFQDPKIMIKTVNEEVKRQQENLKSNKTKGEVRNALDSGETEFLRPLPGKARMYPETDLPLLKIGREQINKLKKQLPKLKSDIRSELKKKGLTDELINLVLESPENLDEFETLLKLAPKQAPLIAKIVTLWRNEISTKLKIPLEKLKSILTEAILEKILHELIKGKIKENDIKEIMSNLAQGKSLEDSIKSEKLSQDTLEHEISQIIKEKPGLSSNAYMGLIMQKHKGKIDAKSAMEIIQKLLK